MDLKDLKPKSDTIEIQIKHPETGDVLYNGDDTPMTITMFAPHTQEYKRASYDQARESMKKIDKATGEFEMPSFEELETRSVVLLARMTHSWDITYEGKKIKFTETRAKEIYTELFWIRDQLEGGINEAKVFT